MNCCDANGKCNGGKGCPAGEPLPIQMHDDPADEGAPMIWLDLITVIVLAAMLIGLGFYVGRVMA